MNKEQKKAAKKEEKEWALINDYEISLDKFRQIIGEEEWKRMDTARTRYFQKKNDALAKILMRKYNETHKKVYLHFLQRMGIDVDYSINDY